MGNKRTVADWIWLLIGIAGVFCIATAGYLFFKGAQTPTKEEAERLRLELAESDWRAGRELLAAGDAKAAVEKLRAAVSVLDLHPGVHNDLGRAFLAAGEEKNALAAWHNARNLGPTYHEPYLHLGRWFVSKDRPEEALHHLRAGLAFHPDPVPAELPQAVAELKVKLEAKVDQKRSELAKRFVANPADAGALAGLVQLRLRCAECTLDAPPAEGLRRAIVAAGKDVEGLDDLLSRQQAAVGDRPGSVVDRSGLGAIFLLRGEFGEAERVFGDALTLGSDGMSVLGAALVDLLNGAESEARMETAVQVLRGNPLPWVVLGAGFLSHQKLEPARQALLNAIRLDPAIPEVCRLFARTFATPEHEKERDAFLEAYRRLLE